MRKIKSIVVHVSDSPDNKDIGVEDIRQWHIQKGWSDVGYHYVVKQDGQVEKGRPIEKPGAHTKGYNSDSIGVCWVGKTEITKEAFASLMNLLLKLLDTYNLSCQHVYGHYEFNPKKTCPNLDMEQVRELLGNMRYADQD